MVFMLEFAIISKLTVFKFFSGFNPVFDSFLTFWAPWAERPQKPF